MRQSVSHLFQSQDSRDQVGNWTAQPDFVTSMKQGFTVRYTVLLTRNLVSILLVTYLPTVLMNIINQATNYITCPDKYELIITVNITCMMVLASVYLSVSTSLPATATIKPVELWLLFNLAYPAMVIVINILIMVKARSRRFIQNSHSFV